MSYPPGGMAPPPPMYGNNYPRTSGKAVAVMVLGIVGLCLFCSYGIGIIPAIVSLAMAPSARRDVAASGGYLRGESQIKAGVVCSWVTGGPSSAARASRLVFRISK